MKSKKPSKELGKIAEDIALSYFMNQGHSFIAKNFHSAYGEIDLITKRNSVLYFVEIKSSTDPTYPIWENINKIKKIKIRKTIAHFFNTYDLRDISVFHVKILYFLALFTSVPNENALDLPQQSNTNNIKYKLKKIDIIEDGMI